MKAGLLHIVARSGVIAALAVGAVLCAAEGFDAGAILKSRAAKDVRVRDDPSSPFNAKPKVAFSPLRYFAPDPAWVFQSKLELYPNPEHVRILDTKSQAIDAVVIGFLTFRKDGGVQTLRVYRVPGPIPRTYRHAIWFTDRTTGDSTYEVGRYLDFVDLEVPGHVYTIDFNLAYNPLCAYAPAFACPIPRKEDHLDLAVTAGEKKWHD